jgi:hypothetical protein
VWPSWRKLGCCGCALEEDIGTLVLFCLFDYWLPCTPTMCTARGPKAVGPSNHWTRTSETMSQSKAFLFSKEKNIFYCAGGTFWQLQKFLQCIRYIILEFTPSTISPLSALPPYSWNSFIRHNFSINMHVHTVFAPYSPSFTISLPPPPSYWYQPSQAEPIPPSCSLIL